MDLFYTTNYQYQLTLYGIQLWLKKYHPKFRDYKVNK
jgi:hypothetical protein